MFLKAPSRVGVNKELMLGKQLPPQQVFTRWGMWIAVAAFYAENFLEFKSVVHKIAEVDDALSRCPKSILTAQNLQYRQKSGIHSCQFQISFKNY